MSPAASHPLVKICCIASVEEARMAVAAGARALGLVSSMPSGPGVIDEALITEIAACVRQESPGVDTFFSYRPHACRGHRRTACPFAHHHLAVG